MWGNIILEMSFLTNFHLGFNNTRSDVLIHLTQWQYWWWFWFSYLWGMYFLLFIRIFRFRVLKFKPRIATTFRPHGKWGDVIVCIIPVSWCFNIITNSNFILRMIEWQSESSLFTLRIRGRQWYWIYKYDFKMISDVFTAPKNVGHNKWQLTTPGDLGISEDFMHTLQYRAHNKWLKRYWSEFLNKTSKDDFFNFSVKNNEFYLSKNISTRKTPTILPSNVNFSEKKFKNISNIIELNSVMKSNPKYWTKLEGESDLEIFFKDQANQFIPSNNFKLNLKKKLFNIENSSKINYSYFNEVSRWTKRSYGSNSPLRIIKYPVDLQFDNNKSNLELFRIRFNEDFSKIVQKPITNNNFLVLKQKKYKPLKTLLPRNTFTREGALKKKSKIIKYSGKMVLTNNYIFHEDIKNNTIAYKFFKKFKKQNENIPLPLWKRMLRTKRTLVLPAQINITVVTNSYDVIHSWFIPGLGLKMDCVPGRATHHVLHIDNVGFYYGQCAEICGRYHHHMPIRICALPFDHFLVWWHNFGLSKLMYVNSDRKALTKTYALRKFVW